MGSGARHDILGRSIGMLVFLLGVGLLVWVFYIAYGLFSQPAATALGFDAAHAKTAPTASTIGTQFGWLVFRVAYLFLMSIAGSLIANKGVNLYFSATYGIAAAGWPHHRASGPPPAPSAPEVSIQPTAAPPPA